MVKKKKVSYWHNFKFKYKLTIINESTLEEVVGIHVSKFNGLSVLLSVLLFFMVISALIVCFTPLRNYLPGYMNSDVRRQIVDNALRIDSMQEVLDCQNLYIMNIQDIFRGTVRIDSVHSLDSLTALRSEDLLDPTAREMDFRKEYEETEKYNLTNIKEAPDVEIPIFYRPARGMVSVAFAPRDGHYGVDISTDSNESVLAVLDGTVVMSDNVAGTGYVIEIQHNRNMISVYKQCGALLKQVGDKVKAGEVIALVGNTDGHIAGPHLHFELWRKGEALNPEKYIVF